MDKKTLVSLPKISHALITYPYHKDTGGVFLSQISFSYSGIRRRYKVVMFPFGQMKAHSRLLIFFIRLFNL